MYTMHGHSSVHAGFINLHDYLYMKPNPKKLTEIELAQEQKFESMLSIKNDKGAVCEVILPDGKKMTWLLFTQSIIPSWLNSKSLLSFRAMSREERRTVKKPLSKR